MNDSLALLEHLLFICIFHAPNSLYDMNHCSTQTVVGELTEVGQRLVVAVGGLGGKGNAALRTKGA
jgi:GTPase involved in cell partitioning and DNA repair